MALTERGIRDQAQQRARAWLAGLPEITGKSLSQLAREAGVAPTTLTKPVNQPGYPHVISYSTISKLVERHHVPPPPGWELNGTRQPGFAAAEAEPYKVPNVVDLKSGKPLPGDDLNQLICAFTINRPGADPWVLRTRALELFGWQPGDIVVLDMNAAAQAGDIVAAQHHDLARGRTETIWRRYDPPYLVAATTDPALMRPIHEDAVAIKGAVVATFRPRQGHDTQ